MCFPQASREDPDFADDPAILDHEQLYRGIKAKHLPGGLSGPVSSAAFKTNQKWGVRRHLSVYRQTLCTPLEVFNILRQSVALASVSAGDARNLRPKVDGVAPVPGTHPAHSRIIRNRTVPDDMWSVVALLLAEACRIVHTRP
ncbi:MAG TPA: hypothetical protein VNA25_22120 [Phycisphaerae bacterium]|nr:hypothetical protein [Phycisphaerae bacterium]